MADQVPIRESVGAALRFTRENLRFIAIISAMGAAATTAVAALALASPALSIFTSVGGGLIQAFTYAAFVIAALFGAGAVRERWVADGGRLWAAMVVIGFFLFIVMFVLSIPAMIALFAGPMAPYVNELQTAGSDQAAVMQIMTRFATENPGALMTVTLFFGVIWLFLTSRLYLAAPATVEEGRILTFETWKWTKGAMLRITGARLLLLAPANILAGALGHLVGLPFGINSLAPAASAGAVAANPVGFLIYVFVATFLTFALFSSLEAGLSSYLYKGLRPREAAPAA